MPGHARVLALFNVAAVQRGRQSLSTMCKGSMSVSGQSASSHLRRATEAPEDEDVAPVIRMESRQAAPPTSARRTVTSRICDCYTQGMDCRVTRYTATDNRTNTLSSVIDINY